MILVHLNNIDLQETNRMWSLDRYLSPLRPLDNQSSVELILKSIEIDLKTPCRYIWIQSVFASFSFSLSTFLLIKDKALLNGTIKCLTCPYLFGCFCSFEFRFCICLNAKNLIFVGSSGLRIIKKGG